MNAININANDDLYGTEEYNGAKTKLENKPSSMTTPSPVDTPLTPNVNKDSMDEDDIALSPIIDRAQTATSADATRAKNGARPSLKPNKSLSDAKKVKFDIKHKE